MPQPSPAATHGSLRVASGSYRGDLDISRPIPILHEANDGPSSQVLPSSDPTFTALPVRPFRNSQSSTVPTPRMRAYGGNNISSHHPQVSVSSHISHDSLLHRRRGSTLKTVMRKLFGRKRQSSLEGDEADETPSALKFEKNDISVGPDRTVIAPGLSPHSKSSPSASNKQRSLVISRLSSASSDNLAATSQENRIEIPLQTIRRRATLPSLILSDDGHAKETTRSLISPVSTRPVSAMSAISAVEDRRENHGDTQSLLSKKAYRRSRSADDLKKLVRHHRMSPIQWRRGSNEMKGWRASVLELDDRNKADRQLQTSTSDRIPTPTAKDKNVANADERNPTSPNELESAPFNIENLIANMADPDASIEQRLTTMEVKLMDLEFAIAKIQGTDNDAFPKSVENTPEKSKASGAPHLTVRPADDPSSAASESSSVSSASFGGDVRPISTATLRPSVAFSQPLSWQAASSSSVNFHGISIEQYSALVTLVRREQTARKALESQVALLQEEMRNLRRSSGMPASPPGTLYPIPSPDSDDARYRRRRDPSSSRKGSATSADTKSSEPRQWDSAYYRSNVEVTSRNTAANMI